jgi:hypothetical protein
VGRQAQEAGLSVFVFTGYCLDELTQEAHRALLEVTDVLVDGRYVAATNGAKNGNKYLSIERPSPTRRTATFPPSVSCFLFDQE